MEPVMSKSKSDTPFRYMESVHLICKTSNAVGHLCPTPTQTLTRLHLILLKKAAPGMVHRRLLHRTPVGVEVGVGVDSISIQNLGKSHKSHIGSHASALSIAHTNFFWGFM